MSSLQTASTPRVQGMSIRELEDEIRFQEALLSSLQDATLENQEEIASQIRQDMKQLKQQLKLQVRAQGNAGAGAIMGKSRLDPESL